MSQLNFEFSRIGGVAHDPCCVIAILPNWNGGQATFCRSAGLGTAPFVRSSSHHSIAATASGLLIRHWSSFGSDRYCAPKGKRYTGAISPSPGDGSSPRPNILSGPSPLVILIAAALRSSSVHFSSGYFTPALSKRSLL